MFIDKKALPRRTVLRGIGATLALPLLDAMVPALTASAQTAANPPRRFGAVFVPLGERPGFWTPATVGSNFEFTPILKPLEKFRKQVTVVSELCDPLDGHATTVSAWLSGALPKKTFAEDVYNGETVDQVIARKIGRETPLPSLELATEDFTGYIGGCDTQYSCAYMNTISWSSATTPVPMEINPRVVFERLFGRPGTAAQRKQRMQTDKSILDSLTGRQRGYAGHARRPQPRADTMSLRAAWVPALTGEQRDRLLSAFDELNAIPEQIGPYRIIAPVGRGGRREQRQVVVEDRGRVVEAVVAGAGRGSDEAARHHDPQMSVQLERGRLPDDEAAGRFDQEAAARDVDEPHLEAERERHARKPGNVVSLPARRAR